ncbi:MAG: PKD domain-containing protein [Spirochaetota bacterium]
MKRFNLLIIAAALFSIVLGGCDMLLESVFPEVTIGTGDSNFSVAVNIEYDFDLITEGFGPGNNVNSIPIVAAFIPFYDSYDGTYEIDSGGIQYVTLWQNTFREDSDGQDNRTTVEFDTWNYSTYKVLVWFDSNQDQDPNIDTVIEPGTLAVRNDNDDYWVDFRYMNPQNAGIRMAARIGASSDINVDQLTANPYADYGSGGTVPIAWVYSDVGDSVAQNSEVWFYSYDSEDQDGWIVEREWAIYDTDYKIATGNGPEIVHFFTAIGLYHIELRVKDNQGNWSDWVVFDLDVYSGSGGTTEVVYYDTGIVDIQSLSFVDVYLDTAGEYVVHWEDSYEPDGSSYSGDVTVSVSDTSYSYYYFTNVDSGYSYPKPIYVSLPQMVRISIDPYYSPGTCRVWITRME